MKAPCSFPYLYPPKSRLMEITNYGHACFGVRTRETDLLFDPFISGNPKASNVLLDQIRADVILITHAHGDHVADVETIANRTGASLISNFEIISYYEKKGLKGHPMNIGGKVENRWGTVKSVCAVHSSVFDDGTYGGNPGGFVVWNEEGCLYHAGDTALTADMQFLPVTCPPLTAAILPIGDNFTMGWQDAIEAAHLIGCKTIIGCHYDTFGYIQIDHRAAIEGFSKAGLQLLLPAIGETISLA